MGPEDLADIVYETLEAVWLTWELVRRFTARNPHQAFIDAVTEYLSDTLPRARAGIQGLLEAEATKGGAA